MKHNVRNLFVFGTIGLAAAAVNAGCSSDSPGTVIGAGTGGTTAGTFGTGGSTAGTFGTSGTATTAGTASTAGTSSTGGTGTAGTGTGGTGTAGTASGGTFGTGTAGTFGNGVAGSVGTAGTGGSTAGSGGTAGTGTGGTGTAGTAGTGGGAATDDFPVGCAAPTGTHGATALTRSCWALTASDCAKTADNMNPPLQAIDAAGATTRYSSGALIATSKAFTFQINLGSAVMVNGVQVTGGGMKGGDFAPGLEVSVSTDGTTFTPVACGPGALVTDFAFTAVSAQYVRLVQHGTADSWWSIYDLNVYSSTGDTCATPGTQTDTCTTPHT